MIIEVNQSNIQEELVTKSSEKTILFYIYDPNEPNLQAITTTLENIVGTNNPYLTLAKGNIADPVIQNVSMQLQVRSIPTLYVFKNGRAIDMYGSDALANLDGISAIIAGLQPSKEEILVNEATKLAAEQNFNGAFAKISEALTIAANNVDIKFAYIDFAINAKKLKEARKVLEDIDSTNKLDARYSELESALTLAEKNQQNPELDILKESFNKEPDNLEIVEKYATALCQDGQTIEALDMLLGYLRKDLNAGNLKKVYLDIIATMTGDPKQSKYRSKLYTLMY